MTISFWIWTHLSFALLAVSLALPVIRRSRSSRVLILTLLVFAVAGCIPLSATDLSGIVLAHLGTLSVSTVLLMSSKILAQSGITAQVPPRIERHQNLVWIAFGILLYPSATGFYGGDVYSIGYSASLGWILAAIALMGILLNYQLLVLCLTSAVLAHRFGLLESPNLWDYLIDPWLLFSAIGGLIAGLFRTEGSCSEVSGVNGSPEAAVVNTAAVNTAAEA